MATRSNIGMMLPDGKMKFVYCHYDGYTEGVGATLLESYSTPELVSELLSFGDMSFLASEIHPSSDTHSFDTPERNVTVFYNRDRGESENDARFATIEEWHKEHSSCIDYLYLFSAGRWFVKNVTDGLGWDLVANCLPEYSSSVTGEDYQFLPQSLTYQGIYLVYLSKSGEAPESTKAYIICTLPTNSSPSSGSPK